MAKRKHDSLDSDDEEPSFGRQVLPVANLPLDFNGTPTDGLQYLFTVRRDARQLPDVVRVKNPYEYESEPTLPAIRNFASSLNHPSVPSPQWRSLFEKRFRNFRFNLNQPTIDVRLSTDKLIPDKNNRDMWWAYLSGKSDWDYSRNRLAAPSNKRARYGGMRAFSEEGDFEKSKETWRMNDEGEVELTGDVPEGGTVSANTELSLKATGPNEKSRDPYPCLIRSLDELTALHLLKYFAHWINRHVNDSPSFQPTESHARWIFALLSRIDDLVSADNMSQLRNLARAILLLLKSHLQAPDRRSESESHASSHSSRDGIMSRRSCWILIAIIVDVWKQKDLWMDAEDLVRSSTFTTTCVQ